MAWIILPWTDLFGGRSYWRSVVAAVAISALLPPLAGAEEALSPPAQRGLRSEERRVGKEC